MQYSGYPQEHRYEVLLRTFKKQQQRSEGDGAARVVTRRRKKGRDWYDRSKFDGVMFVDVTPNGEFKHKVQDACKRTGVKVKVIERMNRTVKNQIQRNNPFGWEHCGRNDCPTCNRDIQINCRARGCVSCINKSSWHRSTQIELHKKHLFVYFQWMLSTRRSTSPP